MFSRFNNKHKLNKYLGLEKNSYPDIFENSPDIILFVVDLKGVIVRVRGGENPIKEMSKQVIGEKYEDLLHPEDAMRVKECFLKAFGGKAQYAEYRVKDLNGGFMHVDVTLVPIRAENNEVIGLYGLTHNITEKQELIQCIEQTERRLQSLLHHADEIITLLDADGNIVYSTTAIETVLGYHIGENTGKSYLDFIHADEYPVAKQKFEEVLKRPDATLIVEVRLKHKEGQWRDFKVHVANHLNDPSLNGIICNLHDITEMKKQQREIQYMAYHDYLTGLPNRRSFEERLDLEIGLANVDDRQFAVMLLNIDGFKYLNDSLGHEVGDLLLREIARKLRHEFSQYIEMIARIDGDEFAILTKPIHEVSVIEKLAKELLKVFQQPIAIKEFDLFTTSCIGVGIYPESGEDVASLMENADLSLYLAKKEGNNNYQIFSPKANIGTYKMFSLRTDLQQALHDEQFTIHYQPIVHPETKQIGSVEALLRWEHPKWGIVPPNEFIPLAEESGLIIPLGEWVLRKVCENVSLWHKAGYLIRASVNLSPVQLFQKELVETIHHILQENQVDPKWLNVEITESTLLEQKEKKIEKIAQLQKLGIQVSMDDFGTGYASFRSLKEIKPDILKLDRSFIKEIPSEEDSVEIITSIIQLAKKLSITVVAEGVETAEQFGFLSELQCDWLQGYLFSRPVPEERLLELLKGEWASDDEEASPPTDQYFRIDLQYPLRAAATVAELNGKKVHLGSTDVLIENIGPGGLRFKSNIKLPENVNITLKFKMIILGEEQEFFGTIVHTSEEDELCAYDISFVLDEKRREDLIKRFNQFQFRLRKEPLLREHAFVTESAEQFYKRK